MDHANDGPREILARRLDDGYDRIEQATIHGQDVAQWETFWLRLLDEYEAVCQRITPLDNAAAA